MNRINFAKKTIRGRSGTSMWASKGTVVLCLSVLTAITIIQIIQWKSLHNVKQEKADRLVQIASLDQLLSEKNKLEKEHASLQQGVQTVKQASEKFDPFFALFGSINKSLGATGSLESLQISGKNLELTIGSTNIKAASLFMQNLAGFSSINSLDLISIKPNATQLLFKMKGTLV